MDILDRFAVAGILLERVVRQARQDLVSWDSRLVLPAAEYFFLEPADGDARDVRTFAGLCAATTINADAAAKAIFAGLKPRQKKRIHGLLRRAGYNVRLYAS